MNVRADKVITGAIWLYRFSLFVLRRFNTRRGMQSASALAYTTLLSIVPLVRRTVQSLWRPAGLQ